MTRGGLPACHQASVTFAAQLIRILRAPELLKYTKRHKVRYGQMSACFSNFFPLLSSFFVLLWTPPSFHPQGPAGGAEDVPGEWDVGAVPSQVQLQHLAAPRECTTVSSEAFVYSPPSRSPASPVTLAYGYEVQEITGFCVCARRQPAYQHERREGKVQCTLSNPEKEMEICVFLCWCGCLGISLSPKPIKT